MMRIFRCVLPLISLFNRGVLGLPSGFRDEGVAFRSGTTGFTFVEIDGEKILLMGQKTGVVTAVVGTDEPDGKVTKVLDIREKVCTEGERGVSQITAHPNFAENRFIYISYTYDKNGGCGFTEVDAPINVVSRFRMNDDLKMVDENIILRTSFLPSKVHNALDMKFGNDGFLYVTLGNGGLSNQYGNSQKENTLLGSLVRITDQGGIPPGNPYMDESDGRCGIDGSILTSGRCSEIWAIGLRNPFRFAMNTNEKSFTQFYVNDVGGATWEEISEVTSKAPGKNYGYREIEGPCKRGSKTNCKPNAKYVDPLYWYEHNEDGDGCVSGGAFVPNGIWPKEYDNKYMFGDFIFKQIFVLFEAEDGCRECSPPRPNFKRQTFKDTKDTGQPVQLTFGPYKETQALYYSLWAPEDGYTIRRIVYEGGNNRSPDAEILVDEKAFEVNEVIEFDGRLSSDPDGGELSFRWDFGDDTSSTASIHKKTYKKSGKYMVVLTVSDANGFEDKTSKTVTVGTPPNPVIVFPAKNETFAVHDVFTLFGYAEDASGKPIPEFNMTWEVRQVHSTHYHPFLKETSGNNIVIPPAPSPEDFHASTNSLLRILLTATDSNGLTSTTVRDIMPKTKKLYFQTDPPGLELTLDAFDIATPKDGPLEVISWVNHDLIINVKDQEGWVFDRWDNGSVDRHSVNKVNATSDQYVNTVIFSRYGGGHIDITSDTTVNATKHTSATNPITIIDASTGFGNNSLPQNTFDDFLLWTTPRMENAASEGGCKPICNAICENINLGGFCEAIKTARLEKTLNEGEWTIFAPDDGALFKAPEALLDLVRGGLSEIELSKEFILYHTVPNTTLVKENLPCTAGSNLLRMGNGKKSRTLCDNDVPTYQKGNGNSNDLLPRLVQFDNLACNGVIHVIDKVLLL